MTEPISNEELDAIQARADRATPGPWAIDGPWWWDDECTSTVTTQPERESVAVMPPPHSKAKDVDARFIAAARTDVPCLVAEVKRLTERWESSQKHAGELIDRVEQAEFELEQARSHRALAVEANATSAALNEELRADLARQAEAHRGEVEALTEELATLRAVRTDRDFLQGLSSVAVERLERRAERAEAAIERARKLHSVREEGEHEDVNGISRVNYCGECGSTDDPCPTIRALDGQPADGEAR